MIKNLYIFKLINFYIQELKVGKAIGWTLSGTYLDPPLMG